LQKLSKVKKRGKGGYFKMKAVVDRDTCIGCGLCESLCPEVFKLNEESKATVIVEVIPSPSEECAKAAQEDCPVNAITVK
jgi:ferredoxin